MPSNTIQPIQQDPQYTLESLVRGMDFTPQLSSTGDTLTGPPTVTASWYAGVHDPSPQSILVGSPSLSSNNMQILQRVSGGISGAAYLLSFRCGTAQGNRIEAQAFFWVVQG